MPNKNYIKGRRKEYKICEKLRREGFDIVQRTAGSHSPFDIIAVHKENKHVCLVQVKAGYGSTRAVPKKYERYRWLNDDFKVTFQIR